MARIKGDIPTEKAVLSGIAQYGQKAYLDISDIVDENCFFDKSNQIIFTCLIKALQYSTTIDMQSFLSAANELKVYDTISNKQELEFIRSIFNFSIKLENVRPLAGKLKKLYIAYEMQCKHEEAHRNLSEITGNESIDHIIGISETPIFDFAHSLHSSNDEQPAKLLSDAEEYMEFKIGNPIKAIGLSSGLAIYDEAIGGGLRRGTVNLMASRPKAGKSTTAKTVGFHCAGNLNIPTLYLDTEMNKYDQIHRLLASSLNIFTRNIETGQISDGVQARLFEFIKAKKDIPFFYKKVSGKPFDEILSIIRRWIFKEVGFDNNGNTNNCLIIYDYFKLMDSTVLQQMQEYQALGFQISKFTDFCSHYDVPALAFVQLNRDGITKDTSDIISQSDRLLWLCSSFSFLRRKTTEEIVEDGDENGNVKLIVKECRFGPSLDDNDYINLQVNYNTASVRELGTRKEAIKRKKSGNTSFDVEQDDVLP